MLFFFFNSCVHNSILRIGAFMYCVLPPPVMFDSWSCHTVTQSTTNKRRQQWCLCRRKNNRSTLYCYDLFMCMSNVMLTRDYWQNMVLVLYIRILINMFLIIQIQVYSKWAFPKHASALIIIHCQCKYLSYSCLMSES